MKQEIVISKETKYSLNEYDIENYGPAVYAINPLYNGGSFRRVHSMMPFEYINKNANDFKWDIYGDSVPEQTKKVVNAFIINCTKSLARRLAQST